MPRMWRYPIIKMSGLGLGSGSDGKSQMIARILIVRIDLQRLFEVPDGLRIVLLIEHGHTQIVARNLIYRTQLHGFPEILNPLGIVALRLHEDTTQIEIPPVAARIDVDSFLELFSGFGVLARSRFDRSQSNVSPVEFVWILDLPVAVHVLLGGSET